MVYYTSTTMEFQQAILAMVNKVSDRFTDHRKELIEISTQEEKDLETIIKEIRKSILKFRTLDKIDVTKCGLEEIIRNKYAETIDNESEEATKEKKRRLELHLQQVLTLFLKGISSVTQDYDDILEGVVDAVRSEGTSAKKIELIQDALM